MACRPSPHASPPEGPDEAASRLELAAPEEAPLTADTMENAPSCVSAVLEMTLPAHFSGNLAGHGDHRVGTGCDDSSSGEDVGLLFTAPDDGDYLVSLVHSEVPVQVYALDGCGGPELACSTTATGTDPLLLSLSAGASVVLVVDGDPRGEEGFFELVVSTLEAAEGACDDGIDTDLDGHLDCQDEDCATSTLCAECPSDAMPSTLPAVFTGTTAGQADTHDTPCGAQGPDATASFTAPHGGAYVFELTSSTASSLAVLPHCDGTSLACEDGATGRTEILLELAEGESVVAVVQSATDDTGPFELSVRLATEDCTDGVDNDLDGRIDCTDDACTFDDACPEDCLDAMDNDGDGAIDCDDSACDTSPFCAEDCTDGVDNNHDCQVDCADSRCADDPACPPVDCLDGRQLVTVPNQIRGTLDGLADEHRLSCSLGGGSDFAVPFTAPHDGSYVFDAAGSAFSAAIALFDSCGGEELTCGSAGVGREGHAGQVVAELTQGQTVVVAVDHVYDLAASGTCGDEPKWADLGPRGGVVVNVAERSERETACGEWRDVDVDGWMGCDDPDCADDPRCEAQRDEPKAIESEDPYCSEHGGCTDRSSFAARTNRAPRNYGAAVLPEQTVLPLGPRMSARPGKDASRPGSKEQGERSFLSAFMGGGEGETIPPGTIWSKASGWNTNQAAGDPRDPIMPNAGLHTGSFPDTVEIAVPKAPNGTAPKLAIVHDHRARDTGLGVGFLLQQEAPILRQSETGGPPNQTAADRYVLGGSILWNTNRGWEPEQQDGRVLIYDDPSNTWTAHLPDGSTLVYGTIEGVTGDNATVALANSLGRSLYEADFPVGGGGGLLLPDNSAYHDDFEFCGRGDELCNTVRWLPSLFTDPFGLQIIYDYEIGPAVSGPADADYWFGDSRHHRLKEIRYGMPIGNPREKVTFTYGPHPYPRMSTASGRPTFLTERLTDIEVFSETTEFSHYQLTYLDQDTSSQDDNNSASYLRTISRLGPSGESLQLRKYEYAFDPLTYSAPVDVTGAFDFGELDAVTDDFMPGWNNETDRMFILPMHLNRDGSTDLTMSRVWCGTNQAQGCEQNTLKRVWSEEDGTFVEDPATDVWDLPFDNTTFNKFSGPDAFDVVDLDGDGFSEILYEGANEATTVYRYDPYEDDFGSGAVLGVDKQAWIDGQFADVNADGCVDLIEQGQTWQWYRNSCSEPWFDGTDPSPLNLEAAGLDDWNLHSLIDKAGWPFHADPEDQTEHVRFMDVNGDGATDMVVSLYMAWRRHVDCPAGNDDDECRWVPDAPNAAPDPNSAFSRIYFGDGFGAFFDSGLAAGAPFLMEVPRKSGPDKDRTIHSLMSIRGDIDGTTMLVGSGDSDSNGGLAVMGSRYRGVVEGFALDTLSATYKENLVAGGYAPPYTLTYQAPSELDFGIASTTAGDSCFQGGNHMVMADFTGDGFADILEVQTDPDHDPPNPILPQATSCGTPFCVTLRKSTLGRSRGRLVGIEMPSGGEMALTWESSASANHDNPDLTRSVEVLSEISGPEGTIELRYGRGGSNHNGFGGFGVVERKRHGIIDSFGFYTTPALRGSPLWAARYRLNGTLERADIHIYGHIAGVGLSLNWWVSDPPVWPLHQARFNPRIQSCTYENGPSADQDLDELLEHCHRVGLPQATSASASSIYATAGIFRYPDRFGGASAVGELAYNAWEVLNYPLTHTHFEQAGFDDLYRLPDVDGWRDAPTAFPPLRFAQPADVAMPDPLDYAHYESHRVDAARTSGSSAYVTAYEFDLPTQRQLRTIERRDTTTSLDDRTTEFTWESIAGYPNLQRLSESVTFEGEPGSVGPQIARSKVLSWSPHGVDRPDQKLDCGGFDSSGVEDCHTVTQLWHPFGEILETMLTMSDGTTRTQRWSVLEYCRDVLEINAVGETRETLYDDHCRTDTDSFRGLTTDYDYDWLGRLEVVEVDPGTHPDVIPMAVGRSEYRYDDTLTAADISADPYGAPQQTVRDDFGKITRTYKDEWDRTILVEVCVGGTDHNCDPNHPVQRTWTGLSTEGKEIGVAPSWFEGESVAASRLTRDGYGRIIMDQDPASDDDTTVSWGTTYHYVLPHRDVTVDVLDSSGSPDNLVDVEDWSTIHRESRVDTLVESFVDLTVLGQPWQTDDAEGVQVMTYDTRNRLATRSFDSSEPSVDDTDQNVLTQLVESFSYNTAGEMVEHLRPDGAKSVYEYDALGRKTSAKLWEETAPDVWSEWATIETVDYTIDNLKHLQTTTTNRQGYWERVTTDELGRTIQIVNSLGHETNRVPLGPWPAGSGGSRLQIERNHGSFTQYSFQFTDAFGHNTKVESPTEGTTLHTFDGDGNLVGTTDADGKTTSYVYSHDGRLLEEYLGGSKVKTLTYDEIGRLQTETTAAGVKSFEYDALERITKTTVGTDPIPAEQRVYTYDGVSERVLTETVSPTSAGSSTWTYTYDSWGRQLTATDPLGNTEEVQYDVLGRPRVHIDEEGYSRVTRYDLTGLPVYEESLGSNVVTTTYAYFRPLPHIATPFDGLRVTSSTDGEGNTTILRQDGLGRMVSLQRADGSKLEQTFDGLYLTQERTVASDGTVLQQTDHVHDADGNVTSITGPFDPAATGTAPVRSFGWTAAGREDWVDADGERTDFTYDVHGLMKTETYLGLVRTLHYSPSPSGSGVYVSSEELEPEGGGDTRTIVYSVDDVGRVEEVDFTSVGEVVTRTYESFDAFGNPTETSAVTTAPVGVDLVETTFGYDATGRLTSRGLEINAGGSDVTQFGYHDNGVLAWVEGPSGKRVTYDYGAVFDHELDLVAQGPDTLFTVTDRDDVGRPIEVVRTFGGSGSTVSLTYDALGRLDLREEDVAGVVEKIWNPDYNQLGQLTEAIQTHYGASYEEEYTYTGAGYLQSETRSQGGVVSSTYSYTLDSAGRRTATDVDLGGGPVNTAISYTTNGLIDSVGTNAVTYDAWHGVTTNHDGATFVRDATGAVRSTTVGGITVRYVRDAAGMPVAREEAGQLRITHWDPHNPAGSPIEEELPSNETLVFVEGPSGTQRLLFDGLGNLQESITKDANTTGSPIAEDSTRVEAGNAFGIGATAGPQPADLLAYGGMQLIDGTSTLHFARHRVLDSATGQFLSLDPAGLIGGDHRTVFAKADPLKYSDAMGLSPDCSDPADISTSSGNSLPAPEIDTNPATFDTSGIADADWITSVNTVSPDLGIYAVDLDKLMTPMSPIVPCHYGQGPGCPGPVGSDAHSLGSDDMSMWEWQVTPVGWVKKPFVCRSDCGPFGESSGENKKLRVLTENTNKSGEKVLVEVDTRGQKRKAKRERRRERREARKAARKAKKELIRAVASMIQSGDVEFLEGKETYEVIVETNLSDRKARRHARRLMRNAWKGVKQAFYEEASSYRNLVANLQSLNLENGRQLWRALKAQAQTPEFWVNLLKDLVGLNDLEALSENLHTALNDSDASEDARDRAGVELGKMSYGLLKQLAVAGVTGGTGALGARLTRKAQRFAKKAFRRCRRRCFVAGTQVMTPTGGRPIEELQPGDIVVAAQTEHVPTSWQVLAEAVPPPEEHACGRLRRSRAATLAPALLLAACGGGTPELPDARETVATFDPQTAQWLHVEGADLEVGDSYLHRGHLWTVELDGVADLGAASVEDLRLAHATWRAGRTLQAPRGADWVWRLGPEEGLTRAWDLEPEERFAYASFVFDTATEAGGSDLLFRATNEVLSVVAETWRRQVPAVMDAQVAFPDGSVQTVTATPDHPFYLPEASGWQRLDRVAPGEAFQTLGGGLAHLLSITPRPGPVDVFNLTIHGVENYFVREVEGQGLGLLVHNTNCGDDDDDYADRDISYPDPQRPVYKRGDPDLPVGDHLHARAHGGKDDSSNIGTRATEENARKAGYETELLNYRRKLEAAGMSPTDVDAVIGPELDSLARDVIPRPTDPSIIDNLPSP
ncbi:MAG: Hint domain-containing protein [Myxococcales bacterium]|nr:Hint domain-containing protein [Myxococcales bacterium]